MDDLDISYSLNFTIIDVALPIDEKDNAPVLKESSRVNRYFA
jgi:hypothetical protein